MNSLPHVLRPRQPFFWDTRAMSHMPRGYIIVSRCLLDHKMVGLRSGHMEHWIDLLTRAAHTDGYKGLARGSLSVSVRALSEDWGISVKSVRCFLAKLQAQNMLQKGAKKTAKKGNREGTIRGTPATVYAIVNYDKYQDPSWAETQDGAQERAKKTAKKGPSRIHLGKPLEEVRPTVFGGQDQISDPKPASDLPPGASQQVDLEEAIQTRVTSEAQQVLQLWNELAARHGLTKVRVLNDARRKAINARIKDAGGLDGVKTVIDYIGRQPVLLGKQKFSDGRTWKADFEYLVRPTRFVANLEKAEAEKAKHAEQQARRNVVIRREDAGW